jgi:hypothetical protein
MRNVIMNPLESDIDVQTRITCLDERRSAGSGRLLRRELAKRITGHDWLHARAHHTASSAVKRMTGDVHAGEKLERTPPPMFTAILRHSLQRTELVPIALKRSVNPIFARAISLPAVSPSSRNPHPISISSVYCTTLPAQYL